MRAVLVDDEKPALLQLERLIVADGRFDVIGKYTSAKACISRLAEDKPDIVFLDIGMPGMNGLEAAEHIRRSERDLPFVYITAYSDYAIEAFELNALDYLLKPVNLQRLTRTLDRIQSNRERTGNGEAAAEPRRLRILCFSQLELAMRGRTRKAPRWRTLKAMELFAYMLHHSGRRIDKERLLETLWPDFGYDKAVTHLHTSVYQVRNVLKKWGSRASIEYAHEGYCLEEIDWTSDTEEFEQLLGNGANFPEVTQENRELYARGLALYRGEYLDSHDYPWAAARRRELQQQYARAMLGMAKFELLSGLVAEATKRLFVLQEKEPYSDEICRLVLRAYADAENWDGLERHYDRFASLLHDELGTEPDSETKICYEKLINQRE